GAGGGLGGELAPAPHGRPDAGDPRDRDGRGGRASAAGERGGGGAGGCAERARDAAGRGGRARDVARLREPGGAAAGGDRGAGVRDRPAVQADVQAVHAAPDRVPARPVRGHGGAAELLEPRAAGRPVARRGPRGPDLDEQPAPVRGGDVLPGLVQAGRFGDGAAGGAEPRLADAVRRVRGGGGRAAA